MILDLHSRRVVVWAVSDRMKQDLAIQAQDMVANAPWRKTSVTAAIECLDSGSQAGHEQ
ncbi:hypothetical protein [Sandarakinorhabdus glacialis]|uniref:hypothetical protein n=1 Tax=Sandarakinorhabdus glacialis TaxID=1614636 RepID=UPI001A9C2E0D